MQPKSGKDLRIVFMGTPDFAVPSLRALVERGYNVVGVVTTPDRPAGRGQKMHQSDVKRAAIELGLGESLYQPEQMNDPAFLAWLKELQPDLGIVIAFRILPKEVWGLPPCGTFNLHASLLPQYRGAAPINRAIMNGETETGVTTFLLNRGIDTGAIVGQRRTAIGADENVGSLYDRLKTIGVDLVVETVERIASGEVAPVEQPTPEQLLPAPKIFMADRMIDWRATGRAIVNRIRGLAPYPAAIGLLTTPSDRSGQPDEQIQVKLFRGVFEASPATSASAEECGTIETDGRSWLKVRCADGWVRLEELQPAGKRAMTVREFLAGRRVSGFRFEQPSPSER